MSAFGDALALTLTFEGGFVDDPVDHGGATNRGITQRVYDHYRNGLNLPLRTVQDITPEELSSIYLSTYWVPARCDDLAKAPGVKLAKVHFDAAVNHGPDRAIKFLQEAVGVEPDGIWGPETAAATATADEAATVTAYLAIRIARYHHDVEVDPSQAKFLPGWLKRVEQLRAAVS